MSREFWKSITTQKEVHWINDYRDTLEEAGSTTLCSPQFHALIGITRGIQREVIKFGSTRYAELAIQAIDGAPQSRAVSDAIFDLGNHGVFANVKLDERQPELPPINPLDSKNKMTPDTWPGKNVSSLIKLFRGRGPGELVILAGTLQAIKSRCVDRGDPYFLELALRIADKCEDKQRANIILEQLGEVGMFSDTLLLGCEIKDKFTSKEEERRNSGR